MFHHCSTLWWQRGQSVLCFICCWSLLEIVHILQKVRTKFSVGYLLINTMMNHYIMNTYLITCRIPKTAAIQRGINSPGVCGSIITADPSVLVHCEVGGDVARIRFSKSNQKCSTGIFQRQRQYQKFTTMFLEPLLDRSGSVACLPSNASRCHRLYW